MSLDVATLRKDFPILSREIHGRRMVYLDSAASSLPPQPVIDAMSHYYETTHANVHRGVYATAEEATRLFEQARIGVGRFVGSTDPLHEVVFTKNTTEAINLLAHGWGRTHLSAGDVVVLSIMEHHANIVPWQMLAAERGIELRFLPLDDNLRLDLSQLDEMLTGAKLLSLTAMSNVLGTITPLAELAAAAHSHGALFHVDAAQAIAHLPFNMSALDIDFLSFSGHKVLGPTGIGTLVGRAEILESMAPFLGGGGMILDVSVDRFLPDAPPARFEAGTPPIAEAIGLNAALGYLSDLGRDEIRAHERELTAQAMAKLEEHFGTRLKIWGPPAGADRGGVLSLELEGVHAHDTAQMLDSVGVCVRPGHHCAKPLMKQLGLVATARASFGVYNDLDDIDVLIEGLEQAAKLFS
jgi:cysteine desulfurase/selenocysteine lyase